MATYSPNQQLPQSVAGPIQAQISKIQAGINSLKGGSIAPTSSFVPNPHDAPGYNPATDPTSSAYNPNYTNQRTDTSQPNPLSPQTKLNTSTPDNTEAPQAMVEQTNQLQNSITSLAKARGLTIQPNQTGGYTAVPDLSSQYNQAAQMAKNSGVTAPISSGAGATGASQFVGSVAKATDSPSIVGSFLDSSVFGSDSIKNILTNFYDALAPATQKTSLVDEYKAYSKQLGLDEINAELINDKKIIEGTEDDIRNEITGAGGTATDSQVMAFANARNKQLIKNYNTLLDTKNAASQQLQTMMQLSIQDRQLAQEEFDHKINFAMQVAQFQQTAQNNARTTMLSLGEKMGWDTVLSGMDPYQKQLTAKMLGLDSSGLSALSSRSLADRNQKAKMDALDIKYKQAQIDNVYSEIAKRTKEEEQAKQDGADIYRLERERRINQSVDELLNKTNWQTVGILSLGRFAPGSIQRDYAADLDSMKANIFAGELTAMRQASKTGGAVGNVSDREGARLESALGALDQGQSPANMRKNLLIVKDSIQKFNDALEAAYGPNANPTGNMTTAPTGEKIIITD